MTWRISPRSRLKFAEVASDCGSLRTIRAAFEASDFWPCPERVPAGGLPSGQRRSLVTEYHAGIDWDDPAQNERVLRAYADFIDDNGRDATRDGELPPVVNVLLRSLQRDGAPIDLTGKIALGAAAISLPLERYDRLREPRAILEHLDRISAGIGNDPAAGIGAAKELVESTCKLILDDYGERYERRAEILDLYKATATVLRLSRESVPDSAKGSQSAHRILQNLATAVQSLVELRNELGIGHGRTRPSPALARHARLAANSARAVVEFLLDTWHERRQADAEAKM